MLITYNDLVKKEACRNGLKYFLENYPFGIETDNLNGITIYSFFEKEYLVWLIEQFKFSCKFTYENSNGYWCKNEYNGGGQITYFENSDGYWNKNEYNDEGLRTYYENSKGCWRKFEYDNEGNLINVED